MAIRVILFTVLSFASLVLLDCLTLVRILVAVYAPVRPVVITLRQEPQDLLPVLAVAPAPELAHPVGGRVVVAQAHLRHVGLDALHGGPGQYLHYLHSIYTVSTLEEVVGQVGDDGGEGVDVARVEELAGVPQQHGVLVRAQQVARGQDTLHCTGGHGYNTATATVTRADL